MNLRIKNYFTDPLFSLTFSLCVGSVCANVVFVFFPHTIPWISDEGQLIDIITYAGYGLLFLSLYALLRDFREDGKLVDYFVYLFLAAAAMYREAGIQHWLASRDTTAIKMRFFTNPDNPLSEKILTALFIAGILAAVAYLAYKYFQVCFDGFFRMETISWSIAALILCGVVSKTVDRIPRSPLGVLLGLDADASIASWEVIEEIMEIFLPVIATIILWQYHLLRKKASPVPSP